MATVITAYYQYRRESAAWVAAKIKSLQARRTHITAGVVVVDDHGRILFRIPPARFKKAGADTK